MTRPVPKKPSGISTKLALDKPFVVSPPGKTGHEGMLVSWSGKRHQTNLATHDSQTLKHLAQSAYSIEFHLKKTASFLLSIHTIRAIFDCFLFHVYSYLYSSSSLPSTAFRDTMRRFASRLFCLPSKWRSQVWAECLPSIVDLTARLNTPASWNWSLVLSRDPFLLFLSCFFFCFWKEVNF